MTNNYKPDEWLVTEEGFDPSRQRASESIFSLGNGHMGQRGNFEEKYSGDSLKGNYVAGIFYPDRTRVGWWKNGYPDYFARVPNMPDWNCIRVWVNDMELDLFQCTVPSFRRELDMRHGLLKRTFRAVLANGCEVEVSARRFLSMADDETAAISYRVKMLNFDGRIILSPAIDGKVRNQEANYQDKFWEITHASAENGLASLMIRTFKWESAVAISTCCQASVNGNLLKTAPEDFNEQSAVGCRIRIDLKSGDEITLYKYISVLSSPDHKDGDLLAGAREKAQASMERSFRRLLREHQDQWAEIWSHHDMVIRGDVKAQQGIRFCIFHLNQTSTGKEERMNFSPKGFTGEKYGGGTYWDTEAFALPYVLGTSPPETALSLVRYRYHHLEKAIQNAEKLGFHSGAALYPMVTVNGEECHNEWEITFEEIHRNGAIAYAIFNYIRYTGDEGYLCEGGLETLIAISRFWRQRVNWSDVQGKYVLLGVTGPNEYENNVNNNWYTNKMAVWTLGYTITCLDDLLEKDPVCYNQIIEKCRFNYEKEVAEWKDIIENMYLPYSGNLRVFLQQDGYLHKEQKLAGELSPGERPVSQHWSWDRILRSAYLKQADVVQGMYLFEEEFNTETIRRNFDFYEPRTLHESSLSPGLHSIVAAKTGNASRALELFIRSARLDLDDYNHEIREGLHITSMCGTWMAMVHGFGGMRVKNNRLSFRPLLPESWPEVRFTVHFRKNILTVGINASKVKLINESGPVIDVFVGDKKVRVASVSEIDYVPELI